MVQLSWHNQQRKIDMVNPANLLAHWKPLMKLLVCELKNFDLLMIPRSVSEVVLSCRKIGKESWTLATWIPQFPSLSEATVFFTTAAIFNQIPKYSQTYDFVSNSFSNSMEFLSKFPFLTYSIRSWICFEPWLFWESFLYSVSTQASSG